MQIDELLSGSPIAFVKWDMNRNVSEPGWADHHRDARELWVRYVQGLYRVWGELRRRHPDVIWEGCSGGGGRVDLGMAALTDQTWVSDNTDTAGAPRDSGGLQPAVSRQHDGELGDRPGEGRLCRSRQW